MPQVTRNLKGTGAAVETVEGTSYVSTAQATRIKLERCLRITKLQKLQGRGIYSGFRVGSTHTKMSFIYTCRGPSKPPFGDCAIYSETAAGVFAEDILKKPSDVSKTH